MDLNDQQTLLAGIERITQIGVSMAQERDVGRLSAMILDGAKELSGADSATLYSVVSDAAKGGRPSLRAKIVRNDTLGLALGGEGEEPPPLESVPLYDAAGEPDERRMVTYAALNDRVVEIADSYADDRFEFSACHAFDEANGYRSVSLLTIPFKDQKGEVIGVLQLTNKRDGEQVTPFHAVDVGLVEMLAAQAALVMVNRQLIDELKRLNEIGIALSSEKNPDVLLEKILLGAKEITGADGGTVYTLSGKETREKTALHFEIVRNDTLKITMGGASGSRINFPDLHLYDAEGTPNTRMVAAYSVLNRRTVNIPDAYEAEGFDFSGTRAFDKQTGYRSKSFLTIPLKDHEDEIIGVLQLINKIDPNSGQVTPFSEADQRLAESLASQAAVAMTNKRLIEELRRLFEAFIQIIASAIDEKSPYTGGHCRRVPILTLMLADAARDTAHGEFAEFEMSDEERYELEIAAWLHDCGKVVTPVNVVDKSTKLETIHDRVSEVETRIEVLKRDAEIEMLRDRIKAMEEGRQAEIPALEAAYEDTVRRLEEEREFLAKANVGGEFMSDDDCKRVAFIGQRMWTRGTETLPLLDENEVYNLTIAKGTLTPEEREIINNHVVVTIKMLESLPFPPHLKNVPEFAGGHHERMDGKGYPRGLTREQMSPQARMMAIADIFEALTASDRPYKERKTISASLKIMGFMKKEGHIDPDLFDLFLRDGVYMQYAEQYLHPDQVDEVDLAKVPGYEP